MTRNIENYLLIAAGIILTALSFLYNEDIFFLINEGMNSSLSYYVWGYITQLGDGFFAALLTTVLIRKYPELTAQALIAFFFSLLLSQGGKELFGGPRPVTFFGDELVNVIGPRLGHRSFPSGHSSTAMLLVWLMWKNRVKVESKSLWLFAGLLIGTSRVAVGAHFPQDVMGGVWAGTFSAWLAIWISGASTRYKKFWKQRSTQLFFYFAVIVSIPFLFLRHKPADYFPLFYICFAIIMLVVAVYNLKNLLTKKT